MRLQFISILFSCFLAFSQTGYSFLSQSRSAVALAQSNAYMSMEAVNAQEFIPSKLVTNADFTISASQLFWQNDVSSINLAIASSYKAVGLGLFISTYSIDGNELRTAPSADPISEFENSYLLVGLSFSFPLTKHFVVGASSKFTREKLYTQTSSGASYDFSLSYNVDKFEAYISTNNVLQSLGRLKEEESKMPEMKNIGLSYHFEFAQFGAEFHKIDGQDDEAILFANHKFNEWLKFYSGYHFGDDTRRLSAGFTVDYYGVQISYGFATHEFLNNYNAIQFSMTL